MSITLTVTAGPHQGQVFAFSGHDTFLVGRSKHAHFQLASKDRYFSRIHFMVETNPPQCQLLDMGSRNGTYVNGERVSKTNLKDGDQIQAGHTVLNVSIEAAEADDIPTASTVPPGEAPGTVTGIYAPSSPPFPKISKPARTARGPGVSGNKSCPICLALGKGEEAPLPKEWALCEDCARQVQAQEQPIVGYLLVQELGRGGMGVVHLAVRAEDGLVVALKTVIPAVAVSPLQVDRFLREASILADLDHPHIVAFRDLGESHGQLYFAMDFVRGTDAGRLLKKQGPLRTRRAVSLICQLLQALEYAHAKKIVHRDIKPANLLIVEKGGEEIVQLADFGLARVYQASQLSGLTLSGAMGGTAPYMAPEQVTHFREAKPPADQYAAAATLYNLLTNRFIHDFPSDFQQQILVIVQDEPVPILSRRPDLPPELASIIHKALAKDPGKRFGSAKAFRRALLPFGQ